MTRRLRAGAWLAAAAVAAAAACGKGDSGQSLAAAMAILCVTDEEAGVELHAPAERQAAKSRWIDARLKHPEARAAFERIGDLPPAERARLLVDLIAKSGIDACPGMAQGGVGLSANMPLPELAATVRGVVPLDDRAPMLTVVAGDTQLVVEGTAVMPLENGLPPVSEKEGGAAGRMLPRLRELTRAHVTARPPDAPPLAGARVLLPPDATYQLLMELLFSMKSAGLKRFELVARQAGQIVAVPIALPELKMAATADEMAAPPPLGIIVAMTRSNIIVFSTSGIEGTIRSPKLTTGGVSSAEIARVQAALADIHTRHTDERRIIVMADATVNMQLVTELLAAVRATPDGGKLFTDVMLSAGFE